MSYVYAKSLRFYEGTLTAVGVYGMWYPQYACLVRLPTAVWSNLLITSVVKVRNGQAMVIDCTYMRNIIQYPIQYKLYRRLKVTDGYKVLICFWVI